MLTFLLAHPRHVPDETLEAMHKIAVQLLGNVAGGQPFTVVLARDDYKANFERAGSWEAWIERASIGADFVTRKPFFDGFIASQRSVGRATGWLLQKAMQIGKPVTVIEPDGSLGAVTRATQVSASFNDSFWLEAPRT